MNSTDQTTKYLKMPVEMRLNDLNELRPFGLGITCPICGKKHIKSEMHPSCCSSKCEEQYRQLVRSIARRDRRVERTFNQQDIDSKNYKKRMENFKRGIGISFR